MSDLAALLNPRSIAIVGASPDTHILRGRTLKVMRGHEYAGSIYPISRSHAEVQGLKAYASIDAVPETIDLAILIIPAQFVPEELERCGRAGVKAVLIITSGFAEEQGDSGAKLQQRIRDIATHYQLIICGPNTEGFVNTAAKLCATFSPVVDQLAMPLVPTWRTHGHLAVIAQSGGMGFAFFDRGRPKEIPFSYIVTTGNEACLESCDVVDYLLDDNRSDAFLMFIENIKNAATFRRVAAKALQAGKPIIAVKIGASEAGQRAAISHTAALAGAQETYRAMFQHFGIQEGDDIEAMVDMANAFAIYRDRLPMGVRVGIGTASGGGGGWLADACVAAGLEVPELDAATREKLDAYLPAYGTSQNPVDGTAQAIREIGYSELARLIASSDRIDAVIMVVTARSSETFERERENLFRVARETRKPILMWSYTNPSAVSCKLLSEAGYPLFTNLQSCARTLAAMARYRMTREAWLASKDVGSKVDATRCRQAISHLQSLPKTLSEHQSMAVLSNYSMPFAKSTLAKNAEEAVLAAKELGGAVALKIQSSQLPHKTDVGGIALRLEDPDDIRNEYLAMLTRIRECSPQASIDGVLVQKMAPPGIEMIVGVQRDPLFGTMLMVGLGGTLVDVHHDVALAPAPLSIKEAHSLLNRLRCRSLLDGVRGAPPSDVDALANLLVLVSHCGAELADCIAEIDLNPVIVHARGNGVTVVDALIVKT